MNIQFSPKCNILAFDTSSAVCSVALAFNGEVFTQHELIKNHQQSNIILSLIDKVLKCAEKIELSQLNLIAYAAGPGSFTGVRLAASIAQGLALPFDLPVVAVSSLQAIAESFYQTKNFDQIVVCQIARENEFYLGIYKISKDGIMEPVEPDKMISLHEISFSSIVAKPGVWQVVGDAKDVFIEEVNKREPTLMKRFKLVTEENFPRSEAVLAIANNLFKKYADANKLPSLPIYLANETAYL